jgi:hypothetical protein
MDELEKVVMDSLAKRIIELNERIKVLERDLFYSERQLAMTIKDNKTGNVPDEK